MFILGNLFQVWEHSEHKKLKVESEGVVQLQEVNKEYEACACKCFFFYFRVATVIMVFLTQFAPQIGF